MLRKRIENAKQLDPQFPWHHRGYLPHFDGKDRIQFLTFRLAGSIPRSFLALLRSRLQRNQISEIDYYRELLHWVIMPTHVHVLLKQNSEYSISSIMHSMKSYTSNAANRILGRSGSFWSVEYFDRYIRNSDHYEKTVRYIHRNPVKAGLCESAEEWEFGCARFHD